MSKVLIIDHRPHVQKCIQSFFLNRVLDSTKDNEIMRAYSTREAKKLIREKGPTVIVLGDVPEKEDPRILLVFMYNTAPKAKYIVCGADEQFGREAMVTGAHGVFSSKMLLMPDKNDQYLQGVVKTLKKFI